jgi:DNA-binding NarL/FixJ family response regulator
MVDSAQVGLIQEAGRHLGINPRTIEVHRPRIMEKLGAQGTPPTSCASSVSETRH